MATTKISVKWRDAEGKEVTEQMYFDVGDVATVAAAQTQLTAYEALLEDVSGCIIVEANVEFPLAVSTVEIADVGYNVRSGVWIAYRNSDGVGDGLYVPGILDGMTSEDKLDRGVSEVNLLLNAIEGTGINSEERLSTRGSASLWATYRGGKRVSRKVK